MDEKELAEVYRMIADLAGQTATLATQTRELGELLQTQINLLNKKLEHLTKGVPLG